MHVVSPVIAKPNHVFPLFFGQTNGQEFGPGECDAGSSWFRNLPPTQATKAQGPGKPTKSLS